MKQKVTDEQIERAVAETGSQAAAARILHIHPMTICKRVRNMRQRRQAARVAPVDGSLPCNRSDPTQADLIRAQMAAKRLAALAYKRAQQKLRGIEHLIGAASEERVRYAWYNTTCEVKGLEIRPEPDGSPEPPLHVASFRTNYRLSLGDFERIFVLGVRALHIGMGDEDSPRGNHYGEKYD